MNLTRSVKVINKTQSLQINPSQLSYRTAIIRVPASSELQPTKKNNDFLNQNAESVQLNNRQQQNWPAWTVISKTSQKCPVCFVLYFLL